ncbi:phage holin family protein [Sphingomonas sp. Tas61C01]|uniref:phage holin family protein n=1 Tax=Sphingomonas sp. Tas61C01 TaxID=3458297 RepID=UPI00403E7177
MIEGDVQDDNVATLMSRLVDDTRSLASAEIALYKARLGERTSAYKNAAVFFAAAGVLALAALIALLVGLILSIATLVGPGFATAIVVGVVLVLAVILAVIGKGKLAPASGVSS